MNIIEERFYNQDRKKYQLNNNNEFLKWYYLSLESGVKLDYPMNIKDFQMLIDTLSDWYQLKYPDYLLKPYSNNPWGERLKNIKHSNISVEEMLIRLPFKQLLIMDCEYGIPGNSSGNYSQIENGREVAKSWIAFDLYDKNNRRKSYSLFVDPDTGIIIDSRIKSFKNKHIETIYQYLKEKPSRFDYHELKDVVESNHFQIELRHRLLQLTVLRILFASNTPEMGYQRAVKFIEEMNNELGLLLDKKEIDSFYQKYKENKSFFDKTLLPIKRLEAKREKQGVQKQPKTLKMIKEKRIDTD